MFWGKSWYAPRLGTESIIIPDCQVSGRNWWQLYTKYGETCLCSNRIMSRLIMHTIQLSSCNRRHLRSSAQSFGHKTLQILLRLTIRSALECSISCTTQSFKMTVTVIWTISYILQDDSIQFFVLMVTQFLNICHDFPRCIEPCSVCIFYSTTHCTHVYRWSMTICPMHPVKMKAVSRNPASWGNKWSLFYSLHVVTCWPLLYLVTTASLSMVYVRYSHRCYFIPYSFMNAVDFSVEKVWGTECSTDEHSAQVLWRCAAIPTWTS